MKAFASLPAVLLMLSCTSLAQTATSPQTAPAQETAPTQQAVPAQQAAAGAESARPEAARPETEGQASTSSPSPAASTPPTEAPAASADGVPAASLTPVFAPGAKLFLEPMDGFDQFVSRAFVKKKVPVVLVKERAEADFVVSGETRLKKPNVVTGMVLGNRGKGQISIQDARTGNVVFVNKFNRVDQMTTDYWIYTRWAEESAKHLKKAMEKK